MKNFKALAAGLFALGALAPSAAISAETEFKYGRTFACDVTALQSEVVMTKVGSTISGSTTLTMTGDTAYTTVDVSVDKVTLPSGTAVVSFGETGEDADTDTSALSNNDKEDFSHTSVGEDMTIAAVVSNADKPGDYSIPVEITCKES